MQGEPTTVASGVERFLTTAAAAAGLTLIRPPPAAPMHPTMSYKEVRGLQVSCALSISSIKRRAALKVATSLFPFGRLLTSFSFIFLFVLRWTTVLTGLVSYLSGQYLGTRWFRLRFSRNHRQRVNRMEMADGCIPFLNNGSPLVSSFIGGPSRGPLFLATGFN